MALTVVWILEPYGLSLTKTANLLGFLHMPDFSDSPEYYESKNKAWLRNSGTKCKTCIAKLTEDGHVAMSNTWIISQIHT